MTGRMLPGFAPYPGFDPLDGTEPHVLLSTDNPTRPQVRNKGSKDFADTAGRGGAGHGEEM